MPPAPHANSRHSQPRNSTKRWLDRGIERIVERPGLGRQFVHVTQVAWAAARRNQITRMAAALSYRTIFGLIPVLVVSLLLVTAYTSEETRRTVIYRVLDFAGLSQIAVPEAVPIPEDLVPGLNPVAVLDASQRRLAAFTVAPTGQLVPPPSTFDHPRERLDDWIAKLMGNIRQFPFTLVGLVGLLTFVYAALSMMVEVEHSFNQVYNAPEGRSWVRRLTQYWTLLSLGPVLLLLSFGVTAAVRVWLEQTLHSGVGAKVSWAAPFLVTVVTALPLTTAMFMLIYSVVPNTRVQPGPALAGAVTAAVLWELGKNGFAAYVTYAANYARLYGTLALIPLFLLWIYLTWLIVLVGLQIAASVQSYRIATAQGLTHAFLATLGLVEDATPTRRLRVVDPGAILVIMLEVQRRFACAETSDHAQIAARTGVDEQVVSDMLERLAGAGLIHRVADANQEGTYSPARPPEQVQAAEVLKLGDALGSAERLSADPVMSEIAKARMSAVDGKTLADLLKAEPCPPAPPGPGDPRHSRPAAKDSKKEAAEPA